MKNKYEIMGKNISLLDTSGLYCVAQNHVRPANIPVAKMKIWERSFNNAQSNLK